MGITNTTKHLKGLPAAPGLVMGPVYLWQDIDLVLPEPYTCTDPTAAWLKIQTAIEAAKQEIREMREIVLKEAGKSEAAIFDAHLMMVDDSSLHEMVQGFLNEGTNPEAAWQTAVESFAKMLADIPDPTLSARAADLRDVGKRVLAQLLGMPLLENHLCEPSVIVARDLAPSQTATMDHRLVLAFCTAEGGPTSHTAILAKALGIPAIVAIGQNVLSIPTGACVLVDAFTGEVMVNPDEKMQFEFETRQHHTHAQAELDLQNTMAPAITRDGIQAEVFANIGSAQDAENAVSFGAEGVGLFRTEFLYLNQQALPNLTQQIEIYRKVIDALQGRPLVVRTLDIGGDKRVDYLGITQEPNPFLGWRGIRMINEKPDLLRDQFSALLLAARGTDLRIMIPMVSDIGEVIQARSLLEEATQAVRHKNPDFDIKLQFGIMVEVPSAALMVEHIAPLVDFFSIGTNDLTQYTLAVDRMNARVARLASPFHPAVLRLVERTVRIAHQEGKWVGMCGELAGEPQAIPFLLGIGLDEYSMSAAAIPAVKRIIRRLSVQECKPIAEQVLHMATAQDVQKYLESELSRMTS